MGHNRHHQLEATHVCLAVAVAVIVYIMPTATGGPGERWCVRFVPGASVLHSEWRMVQAQILSQNNWREVQRV